jgi:hypothetical protein
MLQVPTETVVAEVRVNKLAANLVGLLFTGLLCIAGVLFVHLLPHHIPFSPEHFLYLSLAFILLLPLHEALHALGLRRFAKVPLARHQVRDLLESAHGKLIKETVENGSMGVGSVEHRVQTRC